MVCFTVPVAWSSMTFDKIIFPALDQLGKRKWCGKSAVQLLCLSACHCLSLYHLSIYILSAICFFFPNIAPEIIKNRFCRQVWFAQKQVKFIKNNKKKCIYFFHK